jgi:hypothetical protein
MHKTLNGFIIILLVLIILPLTAAVPIRTCSAGNNISLQGETSNSAPNLGDMRYAINYYFLDPKTLSFYYSSNINVLHWHGPFYGYDGLPDKKKLFSIMSGAKKTVQRVHNLGMKILFYIGPVFSYGDENRRTQIFEFYDHGWDGYKDYLGPKSTDPINWVQRNADNKPKIYKWEDKQGYYLCPNNENERKYVRGLLKLIIETGADGVFFDGPLFVDGSCHCDSCKVKFKARMNQKYSGSELKSLFGLSGEIANPERKEGRLRSEWHEFFADSLADFLSEMKGYARTLNPNFIITANYWTNDPYDSLRRQAQDAQKWSKVVDIFFSESDYETGPLMESGKKYSNSYLYKYLVAASHETPVALLKTSVKTTNPQGQFNLTKLCIAEAASNQAVWQFHKLNDSAQEAAIEYNKFLANHTDLYKGWIPYVNIAVLSSPRQVHFGFKSYDAGVSRFLTDNHIMHKIIVEEDVNPQTLSQYDIVIIPEVKVMNEEMLAQIRDYLHRGGTAVFMGKTAEYDNFLKKRDIRNFFGQKVSNTGLIQNKQINVGRGRLILYPIISLPTKVREGLSVKELNSLNGILNVINGSLKAQRLLYSQADSFVEFNVLQQKASELNRLAVHMVNYAVDSSGRLSEKKNLMISIKLPRSYFCNKALVYSPDHAEDMQQIDFKIENKNDCDYVTVNIHKLSIYSILVLELKSKT